MALLARHGHGLTGLLVGCDCLSLLSFGFSFGLGRQGVRTEHGGPRRSACCLETREEVLFPGRRLQIRKENGVYGVVIVSPFVTLIMLAERCRHVSFGLAPR